MKRILLCLFIGISVFACTKSGFEIPEVEDVAPPSDITVENMNGKSIVSYKVTDERVNHVRIEYMPVENGLTRSLTILSSEQSATLEGFAMAGDYVVTLYAVAESGARSESTTVIVSPLDPLHELALNDLSFENALQSAIIKLDGDHEEEISLVVEIKNSQDIYEEVIRYIVSDENREFVLPNLTEDREYHLAVYFEDRWGNPSSKREVTVRPIMPPPPLEEVRIIGGGAGARQTYSAYSLPTDITSSDITTNWGIDRMFDGLKTNAQTTFFKSSSKVAPWHFSIDLQKAYPLTKLTIYQRLNGATAYQWGQIRRFKIWGSNSPSINGALDNSWVDLGEFEVKDPGGTAAEKIAIAQNGHEFKFVNSGGTEPYRYLRFQFLQNWSSAPSTTYTVSISELEIFGLD